MENWKPSVKQQQDADAAADAVVAAAVVVVADVVVVVVAAAAVAVVEVRDWQLLGSLLLLVLKDVLGMLFGETIPPDQVQLH